MAAVATTLPSDTDAGVLSGMVVVALVAAAATVAWYVILTPPAPRGKRRTRGVAAKAKRPKRRVRTRRRR
jgi:peptidoglycan/LPS O-acetylase OafA/YrhL